MIFQKDKYHYKRNFQIGLIISLLISILAFLYFPKINFNKGKKDFTETIFSIDDIPQTVQNKNEINSSSKKPRIPLIPIPKEINEIEILDNVEISEKNISIYNAAVKNENESENRNIFMPRQLLEVLPEKDGNAEGIIKLSLKIGADGKVNDYKVLSNTTNSKECLSNVVSAVYKSRWEPLKSNGKDKSFWIEKSFIFN